MPNVDYNQTILASLVERPAHTVINDIVCCYAADPFLDAERFGLALQKRGLHALTNWPSGIQFGPSFAGLMDQVSLGYQRELQQMCALERAGIQLYPVIASSEHARQVLEQLKPAGLILALPPGLPLEPVEFADRVDDIVRVAGSAVPLIALGAERGAGIAAPLAGAIVCRSDLLACLSYTCSFKRSCRSNRSAASCCRAFCGIHPDTQLFPGD